MKDSTSYRIAANLAILLVGDQKTGKTNVAMSFPDPYFLDLDKNLDSAVRVAGTKKFWYDTPAVKDDGTARPDAEVYETAMEQLRAACLKPEIKTVVVDSLSTLAIYMCEYIRTSAERMEGKKIPNLRIQDYGTVLSLFQKLAGFLRSTNKTVIVTSHQTWDKDEGPAGGIRYTLSIPGQMKFNFGAFLTDVWGLKSEQAAMGKTRYLIRTAPSGFHVALGKSIRSMPDEIDITNKTPAEIGLLLAPLISSPVQTLKPTA